MRNETGVTLGEQAYTLRLAGLSWTEVAVQIGSSTNLAGNAATMVAKKYALSRDLVWPLHVQKASKPAPEPVEPAFKAKQKSAYDFRCEGFSWADVAELTGYKRVNHAVTAASKHAERYNLPWPIQRSV